MDNKHTPVITVTIPIDILGTVGDTCTNIVKPMFESMLVNVGENQYEISLLNLEKLEAIVQEIIDNGNTRFLLTEKQDFYVYKHRIS